MHCRHVQLPSFLTFFKSLLFGLALNSKVRQRTLTGKSQSTFLRFALENWKNLQLLFILYTMKTCPSFQVYEVATVSIASNSQMQLYTAHIFLLLAWQHKMYPLLSVS